jgi:uncharacterized protein YjbI with pentapeptide repeats
VDFESSRFISSDIDASNCSNVNFRNADLSGVSLLGIDTKSACLVGTIYEQKGSIEDI